MIIGLTGGMGCGKSLASRIFEEFGFKRIDSDALVKERILTNPEVIWTAQEKFGSKVIDLQSKQIDRAALAAEVFVDEDKLQEWEDVVLPRLYPLWKELFAAEPNADWVVEAPLLFEKSLEKWFDFIVCVSSSTTNQYARLAERGLSDTLAGQRISKQLPLALKVEKSDFVLSNDGSIVFLRDQIRHLAAQLRTQKG